MLIFVNVLVMMVSCIQKVSFDFLDGWLVYCTSYSGSNYCYIGDIPTSNLYSFKQ